MATKTTVIIVVFVVGINCNVVIIAMALCHGYFITVLSCEHISVPRYVFCYTVDVSVPCVVFPKAFLKTVGV